MPQLSVKINRTSDLHCMIAIRCYLFNCINYKIIATHLIIVCYIYIYYTKSVRNSQNVWIVMYIDLCIAIFVFKYVQK